VRDWISAHPNERKTLLHMRALAAPIGYIRGQYRWQLFVKLSAKAPDAVLAYLETLSHLETPDVLTDLEIYPNSMLLRGRVSSLDANGAIPGLFTAFLWQTCTKSILSNATGGKFMAIRNIVKIGDDLLRKTSRPVTIIDKRMITLLDDMAQPMYEAQGVGLAAPQVGVLRRVVVAACGEGLIELINPQLVAWEGSQTDCEGCLSVPDRREEIVRPMRVTVEAIDRKGQPFTIKVSGLTARCLCHEIDHLDGVLYVDYAEGKLDPYQKYPGMSREGQAPEQ
jgi:peptide deformylase